MKTPSAICMMSLFAVFLGCSAVQQRGMSGGAYVSTARPAISLQAAGLPLRASGKGFAQLVSGEMLTGAQVCVWLAVYGGGDIMVIAAHAEAPTGWYWDGIMRRPFSVNEGVEVVGNQEFQACTYIVDGARDPFGTLAPGAAGAPVRWIARGFAARANFYTDKIILEYRERLPESIVSLSSPPMGYGDFVKEFERRAGESFIVGAAPSERVNIAKGHTDAVRWRYMDEKFLGSASRYDFFSRR